MTRKDHHFRRILTLAALLCFAAAPAAADDVPTANDAADTADPDTADPDTADPDTTEDLPTRRQQIVSAGPAVTWITTMGPRFGGVDGYLAAYVSPRVALRFGGGTMSAFGLRPLQKVVSSRRALELGADIYLGDRPWRSPYLGLGIKGQYATGWTAEGVSELQASLAVIPRIGARFRLGRSALLSTAVGLTVRPLTVRVRGSDDDAVVSPEHYAPELLPAGELGIVRWF